jgi:hypothetical protein
VDLLLRLAVALLLLGVIVAAIRLGRMLLAARTRRTLARVNREASGPAGTARILYFTAERCVQCRLRQEPALRDLTAAAPAPLHIETLDAVRDRTIAARYRILTAPSTVVIGADGHVAAINHGFAPAEQIAAQLGWPELDQARTPAVARA